ncbi:MAG: SEC-C domain-containing protein [Proteobacteria bacterium]|nr:SEC-C domain-containing protein [Pseudomonadota bacterium]
MKKVGRNDPCPCGSGNKYKHCCLGRNDTPDQQDLIRQVMEEVREKLENREFESFEEGQEFVDRFMARKKRVPQIDFLGLSSQQVHRMLYDPLETLGDMVPFNHGLEPEAFQDIPIVKNTLFFLSRLKELEPLKATGKGNLPLPFARELHDNFLVPSARFRFPIRSEEQSSSVNSLRHVLRMCGWLKKEKRHYALTRKGRDLVVRGFSGTHFFTLLNVFTHRFNWAFQDRYPPFWIIQRGVVFSLYLLDRKARQFIEGKDLGDHFIRAFPAVLMEAEKASILDPADELISCFSLRFLERFCEYFGFVDVRRVKKEPYGVRLFLKKSAFYDEYLNWSKLS